MKVIKRYANRRLYDSETSRTITLDEVAAFVRAGEDIQVIDNISQEDITSKTLGQTFLKMHEPMSNELLVNFILTALIRESGSGFVNVVKKLIFAGIGMANMQPEERESLVQAMTKLESAAGEHDSVLTALATQGQKQADKVWENIVTGFNEVTEKIQSTLVTTLEPLERSKQISSLTRQVDELSKKIKHFQENLVTSGKKKEPTSEIKPSSTGKKNG